MRVLLGTALVRLHAFAEAEAELRKALEKKPNIPKALRELSSALFGQGKGDEAVACLQRIVDLDPGKSVSHFDLSSACSRIGKHEEAQAALQESFRLDPKRQNLFEAIRLQRDGRPKDAEMRLREILRDDPTNATATRALGSIALEEGRYKLATRLLRNAVKLAPDYFAAWVDLSRALTEFEQIDDARDAIAEVIKLEGSLAYPYVLLGNLESKVGDYEAAVTAFEAALNRQADNGGALAGLGHALKTIGRQEQAIDRYRSCIQTYPAFGEAWWSLANLKTFRFSDDEVAVMEQHVDEERLGDEPRVNINFALGKAYEDRGDYDKAFFRYDSGNQLRRPHEVYDPVQNEALHDQIIEMITPQFIEENASQAEQRNDPIFIVGLPRSGSTLIEQILASHSLVDGTHELGDLPRIVNQLGSGGGKGAGYPEKLLDLSADDWSDAGRAYLAATQKYRAGAPYFIDKNPNNFMYIGLLRLILPNVKIINARRHPLDSCFGSYKQLFASGQPFSYDLVELGEYYLQYQRLVAHFHEVIPGFVLDVEYENVVGDFEVQVRRILEYCGLPFEEACLRFHETTRAVKTASSEQVRQPIYASSVNLWKRYESNLGELVEVLQPLLDMLPRTDRPSTL